MTDIDTRTTALVTNDDATQTPLSPVALAVLNATPIEDDDDAPFSLGGVVAEETTTRFSVTLTDADRRDFARAARYFATKPNTTTLTVNFPDSETQTGDERATEYRAKIVLYAEQNDLAHGLPKYVAEHMSKDVVDAATGKITKPAKLIPANKIAKTSNVGANVTFRFAPHRDKDDSGVDTTTVTVTTLDEAVAEAKAKQASK